MGISQSLDIPDNGVPCPIDNMKPAVFVILAVVGLSAAAPQPSHGHGSGYQTKQQCHTTYKTVYETVYEEKCSTVYDTDYKTEYETTYETACETSYKKECYGYGYNKKCKSVPVEKCHQVPKQIPIQVPVQVPREVCDKIPKQVPVQVPERKCDSYGHGHSSGYPHH